MYNLLFVLTGTVYFNKAKCKIYFRLITLCENNQSQSGNKKINLEQDMALTDDTFGVNYLSQTNVIKRHPAPNWMPTFSLMDANILTKRYSVCKIFHDKIVIYLINDTAVSNNPYPVHTLIVNFFVLKRLP